VVFPGRQVTESLFATTLYHEMTEFTLRPTGLNQGWHADNSDFLVKGGEAELSFPTEEHESPWISHSAIVYLNGKEQGLEGGTLRVASGETVEPTCGAMVSFRGGTEHLHSIDRVTKGKRWTLALWLTESKRLQNELFRCHHAGAVLDPVVGERCVAQGRQHVEDVNAASGGAKWVHKRELRPQTAVSDVVQVESYRPLEADHPQFPRGGQHRVDDEEEGEEEHDDSDGDVDEPQLQPLQGQRDEV